MEMSTYVADAENWGNIELAGTNPTYRPLPHRCESHITSHSQSGERCKPPQRVRAKPGRQTVFARLWPQKKTIRGPNLSYLPWSLTQ